MCKSSVNNLDDKLDILEHLNHDHSEQLQDIAQNYCEAAKIKTAVISEIYNEGLDLQIDCHDGSSQTQFIAFSIRGELEEKILYLAYEQMLKQGKTMAMGAEQYFEVQSSRKISANMLSISVTSELEIKAANYDYALLFHMQKIQKIKASKSQDGRLGLWFGKFFLLLMKYLSSKQRDKIMQSMNKNSRYYSVRKCWQQAGRHWADIDVHLHGDSTGSTWAASLQAGDIIKSTGEYKGHSQHLHSGKVVLIADESSLPPLANILENWQNPELPTVFVALHHDSERQYLQAAEYNRQIEINYLANDSELATKIIAQLEAQDFSKAWCALEAVPSKSLRHYFRSRHIASSDNKCTAYWRAK